MADHRNSAFIRNVRGSLNEHLYQLRLAHRRCEVSANSFADQTDHMARADRLLADAYGRAEKVLADALADAERQERGDSTPVKETEGE